MFLFWHFVGNFQKIIVESESIHLLPTPSHSQPQRFVSGHQSSQVALWVVCVQGAESQEER